MLGGLRFRCYDWGALGWLLDSGRVDTSKYKFFVFLNSSIRGPFLPAFWPVCPWPDGMHAFWPAFRFIEACCRAITSQKIRALRENKKRNRTVPRDLLWLFFCNSSSCYTCMPMAAGTT